MVLTFPSPPPDAPPPPPPPPSYGDEYAPPPHRTYPSAVRNKHPKDDLLHFEEASHTYVRQGGGPKDGIPFSDSVTHVAHCCSSPFDGLDAIDKMQRSSSQRWPRLQFVVGSHAVSSVDDLSPSMGCLLQVGGITVSVLRPHDMPETTSSAQLLQTLVEVASQPVPPDADLLADGAVHVFEREKTSDEILAAWARNGLLARNEGTEAHLQMQLMTEGEPFRLDPAVRVGLAFFQEVDPEWEAWRMEWEIWMDAEDEADEREVDLAGSVDLVLRNRRTGDVVIVDYKLSPKLESKMRSRFGKMRAPLDHLEDTDGPAYGLQLSIYQWMLEKGYGLRVVDRVLLSIAPSAPYLTSVPYLKEEVELLMRRRKAVVRARREWASLHPEDTCALTGVALHAPFLTEDGKVVDAKIAAYKGLSRKEAPSKEEEAALKRVASRVEKVEEEALSRVDTREFLKRRQPWWKLFPKTGGIPSAVFGGGGKRKGR